MPKSPSKLSSKRSSPYSAEKYRRSYRKYKHASADKDKEISSLKAQLADMREEISSLKQANQVLSAEAKDLLDQNSEMRSYAGRLLCVGRKKMQYQQ